MKLLDPQSFDAPDPPAPADPVGQLRLRFKGDPEEDGDHPVFDLSACATHGRAIFVAGDECHSVERLILGDEGEASDHRRFELSDYLDLFRGGEEMDIEGLAVADDWLWVCGSHSRTRPDPRDDSDDDGRIDIVKVGDLKDTRARCVLARIPLVADMDGHAKPVRNDGDRRAGLIKQKGGEGSKLRRLLCENALLGPSCAMAAKEGGLDIEGIAAAGEDRVALGLRGPVIQTYGVLVEPDFKFKKSGRLHLHQPLRIRLVELGGLGVRDLCVRGKDLYLLAGPVGDLDGRCVLYRWEGWADCPPEHDEKLRVHCPERLFDIPVKVGADHPEGIDWIGDPEDGRLLVVYDSPAKGRLDLSQATIIADVFEV
ncbi:DUF3616 domain-containing protein [Sphingomicrobium sp. XHP0235]|uniref:DUF3616 domain-containing protein n=1 Tax=Sphingomicrobium aquimarinum TaxID=3133971 RepID=UPI0031FED32A